jgi:hypothetical protein
MVARASSQYGTSGWSALQAIGEPNTPDCGDLQTAWASKEADSQIEWIELDFPKRMWARGVRIVETFNPGGVSNVEVRKSNGNWESVWSGIDPTQACPGVFDVSFSEEIETNSVRLVLQSGRVPGWNEIDAVGLIGSDSPTSQPEPPKSIKPRVSAAVAVIIAVFEIQDASKSFSQDTMAQLTEYLANRLTEAGGFRVIPQDQIRSRLDEEKRESYKACYDQGCQIELGRSLAAQKSLATKIIRVGNRCAVTSALFDLRSETTETAATVKTQCAESDLMEAIDQITEKLSRTSSSGSSESAP